MDTSGTDAVMRPSAPSAVPPPGFKTSRHGFDQAQVLEYIGHLTARLQTVEDLQRRLRSEADQALQQRDEAMQQRDEALQERASTDEMTYAQVSDRVTELLVTLDREVARIHAEAEAEAAQIVTDARSEAHRMRLEAEESRNAAAHEAKQARKEAERSVAELTSRRDEMLGELRSTFGGLLDAIGKLAASIDGGKDGSKEGSKGSEVASLPTPDERTVVLPDVMPDRPA